jgi:putative transferase (TIGR04331 family)|tara:strand:- start:5669 stop:7453 length:1785 start_codon:yes stop_codon:yes gene_type:complete
MEISKKNQFKNIRATGLKEFWGSKYDDDIYLWNGAKHGFTLAEIDRIKSPTLDDNFSTTEEVSIAFIECQKIYYKFSELVGDKLNEIHKTDLPVSFWRTAFGYWFFRHIHIVYEKYSYLCKLSIDKTSIKLLDKKSFFIPNDSEEYVQCFCSDFGVQQLVSQYYYLFKSVDFPIKEKSYDIISNELKNKKQKDKFAFLKNSISLKQFLFRIITKILPLIRKPKIILLGVNYSAIFKSTLIKSKLKIQSYILPELENLSENIDKSKRQEFLDIKYDNNFELYLISTLYHCFPKILIEKFNNYYEVFENDIKKKQFKYIVSEGWISNLSLSIYIAIAKNNNKEFLCQEHAAFGYLFRNNYFWYELLVSNKFITTGWQIDNNARILQGGIAFRRIKPYLFDRSKKNILFICHVRYPYIMEFGVNNEINSGYLKSLRMVNNFIDLLPKEFTESFLLRPRSVNKYFWDSEHAWDINKRAINIDRGNFHESIQQSKVVIIDHISSGVAELILMNVPFIIIHDNLVVPIAKEFENVFKNLSGSGVVQNSAESTIEHLKEVYDNVDAWWRSEQVKTSINELRSTFLAPSSNTTDLLLKLLKE